MKNKLGKKLLVGGACACMLLTGGLTLSGCSLSDEQQKALDVLVANTETLVNDFGSYLDGQNAKIDKEKAVEMIEKSRLNFVMSNFDNLQMTAKMYAYQGYEDVLRYSSQRDVYFSVQDGVKIEADIMDGNFESVSKSDFNNDLHYSYSNYENNEVFNKVEYTTNVWTTYWLDIFSQTPVSYVGNITEDDIYNIKAIEGGYEFEIVAQVSNITETDLSKYEEDAEAVMYNIIMKVEIKNDYITKVDFKGVQTTVPVTNLLKTNENQTIVLDLKGMPTIDSYEEAEVVTMVMDVEYKYSDIDYSAIENKIAEIEATYLN